MGTAEFLWVEIEATEMEIDRHPEAFAVGLPASFALDPLDLAVDAVLHRHQASMPLPSLRDGTWPFPRTRNFQHAFDILDAHKKDLILETKGKMLKEGRLAVALQERQLGIGATDQMLPSALIAAHEIRSHFGHVDIVH